MLHFQEIFFLLILLLATVGIGILCWVWMKNSRVSQKQMAADSREMVRLLAEQNELLRKLAGRETLKQ